MSAVRAATVALSALLACAPSAHAAARPYDFNGDGYGDLAEAITLIFERRAEHAVPASLPEPPAAWATPWRRLARDVPAPDELAEGYRVAAALFDPILAASVTTGTWQPGEGWVT